MNGENIVQPELSLTELRTLMEQVQDAMRAAMRAEEQRAQARIENVEGSVARLDALLGPEDAKPYDPSGNVPATIRSVGAHDQATLAQNSGLALDLILAGMEELASTTKDIAIAVDQLQKRTNQY